MKSLKRTIFFDEISEISELRKNAIDSFTELGFPTLRDEDWRFTNLTPISKGKFKINGNTTGLDQGTVKNYLFNDLDTYLLVFVNGKFNNELSNIEDIPKGVTISSLSVAKDNSKELLAQNIGKFINFDKEAFNALNTSFFEDGLFINVPDSVSVEKPVHALYINHDEEQSIVNPRNLILVGSNSELKVIEHYVSTSESSYLSNVVSEVYVGGKQRTRTLPSGI